MSHPTKYLNTALSFQVRASWRLNLQEVFCHSALSCYHATCKRCFSNHRSSWLEDQSISSPTPSVRLPRLQPRTRLPLPSACFSSVYHGIPCNPHNHTLKCTVCKSAPRGAAHLFSKSCHPPKNIPKKTCQQMSSKMRDKHMTNKTQQY